MREKYTQDLEVLDNELIEMGKLIEQAISWAVDALINKDVQLAQKAINADDTIDNKEKLIAGHCLRLLLQQQPVAYDLRLVSAVNKMITDMERIGDHAADISEITLLIVKKDYSQEMELIHKMADEVIKMINDSIEAFIKRSSQKARCVQKNDNNVDNLFNVFKENLIGQIQQNSIDSSLAIDMIMIAKYFERIGDHAVNIAEWVEFSQTGMYKGCNLM